MSELRQDRTTGAWVIVAPQRGLRPQWPEPEEQRKKRLHLDPTCPFCPGNEVMLPGIIAATSSQEPPGWSVRIVPNKFPALDLHPPPVAHADHSARPGGGIHEVIIESPRHDADPATMNAGELNAVVTAYRDRSRILLEQDGIEAAILFRNHGSHAGASLSHPHAQVIALDVVPPRVAALSDWGRHYHDQHGRCALCDEIEIERKDGRRIVDESNRFVTLVPFAAEHPFELWIVPRQHQSSFTALPDEALSDFAALLGRSLRRLQTALDHPPYNLVIDSAPNDEFDAGHWHWKMRIVPVVAVWGGFELGAGLPINPSSPEEDARILRASNPGP